MALPYSWLLQVQTGVEVQGSCTPISMADLLRAGQELEIKVMDTVSLLHRDKQALGSQFREAASPFSTTALHKPGPALSRKDRLGAASHPQLASPWPGFV